MFEDDYKHFPRLFRRDNDNRIDFFKIHVEGDVHSAKIVRKWGLLTGKQQVKTTIITQGKNLGKSNATTAWEQAVSEATSMYKDKVKEGYKSMEDFGYVSQDDFKIRYENVAGQCINHLVDLLEFLKTSLPERGELDGRFRPMLLHHYRLTSYEKGTKDYKDSKPIAENEYPIIVQPKLDGLCTLATPELGLWTRSGEAACTKGGAIWNDCCPNIAAAIKALNVKHPLHGETYKHGLSLQQIKSACSKPNADSKKLQLVIFDVVLLNTPFKDRLKILLEIEHLIDKFGLYTWLMVMPHMIVNNEREMLNVEESFLNQGYEGIILRKPNGLYYTDSRSTEVLKLVRENSKEVLIVDVVPMDNEPTMGKFLCQDEDSRQFYVNPSQFTQTQRIHILNNPNQYINQYLTIKYRGFTDDGIPRFAQGVAIRGTE